MSPGARRVWKRIWWCLRIRDTLISGSIGRPQHFSIHDCDVEMLEPHDLNGEFPSESQSHYVCQMARLSTIFSGIISSRYAAVQTEDPSIRSRELEKDFAQFLSQIPPCMVYHDLTEGSDDNLWAAMLLTAYNFGVILLCRPPHSNGEVMSSVWGNHGKALIAANQVTRVMEDILSVSMGRACQIHTIPALFNALAMHVFTICVSRDIGRELAENRARTCMLGLTSLQDSWPVSGWILRLFVYIMDKLKIMSKSASLAKASISRPEHVNNNAPFESWPSTGESVTNTPRQGRHARESHDINPDFNSPAINIEVSETGDFPGNVSFDGFSDLNEQGQANFFDFLGFLESADFAAGFNS